MPSKKTETAVVNPATASPPTKDDVSEPPLSPTVKKHRRGSSSVTDVLKPEELKIVLGEDKDLVISKEVAKLNWKMNSSPMALDEAKAMKEVPVSNPKVRKLNIFFSTGLHVTARASPSSTVGVSVYDVLTAIHKLFKKKADDELENPVLANIEWGRGDDLKNACAEWPAAVLVTQKREQEKTGKKKNK